MFDLTDATVAYVDALVGLFFVFGVAIIIYSLDDVVVDIIYWAMRISGTIHAERSHLSEQALLEQPQRPLAVMVPAWREEAVIYDMLKTNAGHSATTVFFVRRLSERCGDLSGGSAQGGCRTPGECPSRDRST